MSHRQPIRRLKIIADESRANDSAFLGNLKPVRPANQTFLSPQIYFCNPGKTVAGNADMRDVAIKIAATAVAAAQLVNLLTKSSRLCCITGALTAAQARSI